MEDKIRHRTWLNPTKEKILLCILLFFTLVTRLWDLDARPLHHDESLHAVYSWYINLGIGYQHMPMMHGPFQFLANSFIFFLFGDSEVTARLMYAIFGIVLVGMPWFLRRELGQIGAIVAVGLLAFSPTIWYFSRFARNDILIAVWLLGIVVCMWRFLGDPRPRYLFLLSFFMALSFATKETTYLSVFIFISYFTGWGIIKWVTDFRAGYLPIESGKMPIASISHWDRTIKLLKGPQGTVVLLLGALALTQSAAVVGIWQESLGLVLLNADSSFGPIGLPDEHGNLPAIGITLFFVIIGGVTGLILSPKRWVLCLAIFWCTWLFFFSSGFTNPNGVITGLWQSLGYWIVQQDVGRGGQPWYYYLLLVSTYEFLPIIFSLVGMALFGKNGGPFERFLMFWLVATFVLFSIASEKMPWLLVHICLPGILLASLYIGRMVESVSWSSVKRTKAWIGVVTLPFLILLIYRLGSLLIPSEFVDNVPFVIVLLGLSFGCLFVVKKYLFGITQISVFNLLGVSFAIILLIFSIRAGFGVTFRNQGIGNELLVYTQTSPDLLRVSDLIHEVSFSTHKGNSLSIIVDSDEGFTWPWAWYLRGFDKVNYLPFDSLNSESISRADVLLINSKNVSLTPPGSEFGFVEIQTYRHRQWFPEVYRGLHLRQLTDRSTFGDLREFWLSRNLETPIGSQGGVLYYSVDLLRDASINGKDHIRQNP